MGWAARRGWKVLGVGGIVFLLWLSVGPAQNAFLTARLLFNLGAGASAKVSAEGIEVRQLQVSRPHGEGRSLLYRSRAKEGEEGIVFVPGVTPLGIRHPRFVALSQTLAGLGYVVLTPEIESLRDFTRTESVLQELKFWYQYLEGGTAVRVRQVGLMGVSVSGTLALMTAADPDIRDRVAYVVSIGGYYDLMRCNRRWFSPSFSRQLHGHYPVQYYGRWVSMLGALDLLKQAQDREAIRQVLQTLLATGKAPLPPGALTEQGERWYRMATAQSVHDPELVEKIEASLAFHFSQLSPDEILPLVRCPVFLLHGLHDELIPSSETLELHKRLTAAESHVLLTPLISHTHSQIEQLNASTKWLSYLHGARFLYAFVNCQTGLSEPQRRQGHEGNHGDTDS